ncbi:hypothetical protein [Micromonospora chalcea]|uniref:hypothetical protein n=1 Tax=Micromonospora chalcea TaxID=1874 RepID=UPI0038140D35
MREVAASAARHQDDDLYRALVKIGRGALAQGGELVPQCGLFLRCPVCEAVAGQQYINVRGGCPYGFRQAAIGVAGRGW